MLDNPIQMPLLLQGADEQLVVMGRLSIPAGMNVDQPEFYPHIRAHLQHAESPDIDLIGHEWVARWEIDGDSFKNKPTPEDIITITNNLVRTVREKSGFPIKIEYLLYTDKWDYKIIGIAFLVEKI